MSMYIAPIAPEMTQNLLEIQKISGCSYCSLHSHFHHFPLFPTLKLSSLEFSNLSVPISEIFLGSPLEGNMNLLWKQVLGLYVFHAGFLFSLLFFDYLYMFQMFMLVYSGLYNSNILGFKTRSSYGKVRIIKRWKNKKYFPYVLING